MTNEDLCILAQSGNSDAESELIDHLLPCLVFGFLCHETHGFFGFFLGCTICTFYHLTPILLQIQIILLLIVFL